MALAEREAQLEAEAAALERKIRTLGRPLTPEEQRYVRERVARMRLRLEERILEKMMDDRPEIVSAGRPVTAFLARKGQEEARARLELKAPCSDCPAATVFRAVGAGMTVHCAVEDRPLSSATDPQSLLTFCLGEYEACPSWRAEKEALARTGHGVPLD